MAEFLTPDQIRTRLYVPRGVSWAAGFLLLQGLLNLAGVLLLSFDPAHLFVTMVSALIPALGLAQCIAAIGLLRLKRWARTLGVGAGATGAAQWSLTLALFPLGSWIFSVVAIVLVSILYYRLLAPLVDATTGAAIASAQSAQGKVEFVYLRQGTSFQRFARACGFNRAADRPTAPDNYFLKLRSNGAWRESTWDEIKNLLDQASLSFDMASVWRVDDRIGLVSITSAADTDAWRYNTNYCFDESGRVRRFQATLTFLEDNKCSFIQTREYDASGAMTAYEQWYEDSDSDRRLSHPPPNALEYENVAATLPIYVSAAELPFLHVPGPAGDQV